MWGGVGLVLRLLVGGGWRVAGALKLPDPAASVRAVLAYDLLPESIVPTVGHVLPLAEIVIGACLVVGLFTRWSALPSGLLFLVFIIGIDSAWQRGLQIDCGCFGGGGHIADAKSTSPLEISSEERRVGHEGVHTVNTCGSQYTFNNNDIQTLKDDLQ